MQKETQQTRTILFYGDSIMDVKTDPKKPQYLGQGFPKYIQKMLNRKYLNKKIKYYNTSKGGIQTKNLYYSLKEKCIKYKPNIIIILIGINDTWDRQYEKTLATEFEQYRFQQVYETLIKTIHEKLLETKIIIIEPYYLPTREKHKNWEKDLKPKRQIIKNIARKYMCIHIPMHEILNTNINAKEYLQYVEKDGVHPTNKGHAKIAEIICEKIVEEKLL